MSGDGSLARRETMEARGHFWVRGRRRLVLRILDREAGLGPTSKVVALGCGGGGLLPALSRRAGTVVGVDVDPAALAAARGRAGGAALVLCDGAVAPFGGGGFDAVLALDVLEHVPPAPLLREAARIARPGGALLVSVPASPALWSGFDARAGHRRRYRWPDLRRELTEAGWDPGGRTHWPMTLYPLAWASRRIGRGRLDRLEREPPEWLDRALGAVARWEVDRLGDRRVPFGSSLFAWARRASR